MTSTIIYIIIDLQKLILLSKKTGKSLFANTIISGLNDVRAWTTSLFDEYIDKINLSRNFSFDYNIKIRNIKIKFFFIN